MNQALYAHLNNKRKMKKKKKKEDAVFAPVIFGFVFSGKLSRIKVSILSVLFTLGPKI
jgi:hypothetical protein